MNKLNKRIGHMIRDHRQIKQMTQLELSRKLGYTSTQFVSLFERGLSKCPPKTIGKICKLLDIDPIHFYDLIVSDYTKFIRKDLGIR